MYQNLPNRRSFLQRSLAFLAGLTVVTPLLGRNKTTPSVKKGVFTSLDADTPSLGDIVLVPFDFAPRGWAICAGQLLPIAQNTALFSLLGTTYGGDGRTTFALPDLRGRMAVGSNNAAVTLGERSGSEATTLTNSNIPPFNMTTADKVQIRTATGTQGAGVSDGGANGNTSVTVSGGSGTPMGNMPPYLAMNYIIAMQGIFPSRP